MIPVVTVDQLPPPPAGRTGWPWDAGSPPLAARRPDGSAWPSVSIITPSYNQADYLEETIRSVLLQGYPNLEYVVIDGGSSDGSIEIIRRYAPWLTAWISEPDDGQTDAIAKGARACGSDFIAWQNSDDTYLPRALAALFGAVDSADIVYSDCYWTDAKSAVIGRFHSQPYTLNAYLFNHIVGNQTAFIRRSAWDAVGGINVNLRYVMEEDLWIKLGLHGATFKRIDGVWGTYRLFSESKSGGQTAAFYAEHLQVLRDFFAHPDVPAATQQVKNDIMARAHLIGACRLYTDGRVAEAQAALRHAIALKPTLATDESAATAKVFGGWARFPVVADPFAFLTCVFDNLPREAASLRRYRGDEIGRLAVEKLFKAHAAGDQRDARQQFLRAVRHNPRWLTNRGVLKAGSQALVGALRPTSSTAS